MGQEGAHLRSLVEYIGSRSPHLYAYVLIAGPDTQVSCRSLDCTEILRGPPLVSRVWDAMLVLFEVDFLCSTTGFCAAVVLHCPCIDGVMSPWGPETRWVALLSLGPLLSWTSKYEPNVTYLN